MLGDWLFVDPEASEGVWLRTSLRDDITVIPGARIAPCTVELRTFLDGPLEGFEASVTATEVLVPSVDRVELAVGPPQVATSRPRRAATSSKARVRVPGRA